MKNWIPILTVLLVACTKVPITGRKQMNLLPEDQMIAMSQEQYQAFLQSNNVETGTNDAELVERVGKKMAQAVETYMRANGHSKRIANFDWEYKLVQSEEVNAWCMPGGKICFYTGILPICKDEQGVAVVMGHEIAHAIARHGNERMSQGLVVQAGGVALSVALAEKSEMTQDLFLNAYGIGAQAGVMLPFSRKNELEADKLGLVFMQLAGYDAKVAIDFWKRMAANGAQVPEFLSTHPSDERRVEEIEAFLASSTFEKHTH